MKQRLQGAAFGFILALALVLGVAAVARPEITWKKIDVAYGGYKVYVDGVLFEARGTKGEILEPFNFDGWIYAPFEHIAKALGKSVRWDGDTHSLYINNPKPIQVTLKLKDAKNIGNSFTKNINIFDNYGNRYDDTCSFSATNNNKTAEYLLDQKYTEFRGTFFILSGDGANQTHSFRVEADGNVIYTSPILDKTSAPVKFNINISGYNHIKIMKTSYGYLYLGDAGFY